jgi:hypothetical protein
MGAVEQNAVTVHARLDAIRTIEESMNTQTKRFGEWIRWLVPYLWQIAALIGAISRCVDFN